jgi:hypothetical protein
MTEDEITAIHAERDLVSKVFTAICGILDVLPQDLQVEVLLMQLHRFPVSAKQVADVIWTRRLAADQKILAEIDNES